MPDSIYLVAGLGRCGSSLVMRLLHLAGRPPAAGSALFSYECSVGVDIENDPHLIEKTRGQAIKILHPFFRHLPEDIEHLRVLWIDRTIRWAARSSRKFMRHHELVPDGERFTKRNLRQYAEGLKKDRADSRSFLEEVADVYQEVRFEDLLRSPYLVVEDLIEFAEVEVSDEHFDRLVSVIDVDRPTKALRQMRDDHYGKAFLVEHVDTLAQMYGREAVESAIETGEWPALDVPTTTVSP